MPSHFIFALIFVAAMGFVAGRLYAEVTVIAALQQRINDLQRISWGNKCEKHRKPIASAKETTDRINSVTYEDDNA